ncbi:nucleotidyltransferase domain-containing protein [Geoglobus acetivorans]|uniref:Nucleotidyltransferase domain-containing protein n=1 Tax=Geoglobus acetivorans TaxID=565033 RepID=A0ABZ3H3F9_GEOAI|nr:nucleotidyltransferase domain-containing protein [Geoglobus acetivorans]
MELPQISDNKQRALESFVRILKEKYGDRIRKIILFGSAARGEAGEESDIDVLIVASGVSQREVSRIAFQVLMEQGGVISSIVEEEEQFEKNKNYSFHRIVLREGVEIG